MKKKMTLNQKLWLVLLIATLVIAACDNGNKTETENPDQVIPTPTPIEKTYTIELKDGALKFNVKYMALPDAVPPAYLEYLKERLEAIAGSASLTNQISIENLIINGDVFTIIVENTGDVYEYLIWDATARVFKLHYDWISTATELDLSLGMMRSVFNSVTLVTVIIEDGLQLALINNGTAYAVSGGTVVGDIIIPAIYNEKPITRILAKAFENCTGLTSIKIPDGVTSIGDSAFYYCTSLTSINIPDGVTSIGDSVFLRCSSLTSINIHDSVTSIGNSAFSNCSSLTSITIPSSVTSIGYDAFRGCSRSLTSITVDNSNTAYYSEGNCLIDKSNSTLILGCKTSVIPDGVTSIGNNAFSSCNGLTSIIIPSSVISIGNGAFYNCLGLTSINILDGVTSIGDAAFTACNSLSSITIPSSVTIIGNNAFYHCMFLTSVTFNCSISSSNFSSDDPFPGDLRDKYFIEGGGIGSYTRTLTGNWGTDALSGTWTKQ